jgi:GLPGLI family protein
MKNVLLAVFVFFALSGFAQKSTAFQGTITYAITFEGEMDAMSKAQMPTEMKQMYKDTKVRTEQISSMGTTVILSDVVSKSTSILFDMMGTKMAITQTKEDIDNAMKDAVEPKITETAETKTICGYNCKKAIVEYEDTKMDIYYTTDIEFADANALSMYKGIKGILMEYGQAANGVSMKFVAKEVKKGKIKDTMYAIPSDYQIMTQEQFRSMLGQ